MQAAMKRAWVQGALTLALALAAGCFQPKLKNFGFACDPSAAKPCPDGYFCNSGYCDDGSGGTPPGGSGGNGSNDLAMSQGGSGGGGGGGQQDMAMSVQDMAQPQQDLATPPDMTQGSTCAHDECSSGAKLTSGCSACVTAVCNRDSYCCDTKWDSYCINDVARFCTTKTCS